MRVEADLLHMLKAIQDKGPLDRSGGICEALICMSYQLLPALAGEVRTTFRELSLQWPMYSGNPVYPVPAPDGGDPAVIYNASSKAEMWEPSQPYGALRLELLAWCINELEKELAG